MKKLNLSIHINASSEKVWKTIIGKETYPEWTAVFDPESRAEGTWEEGSKMLFLGPDPGGGTIGMVSIIDKSLPGEFLSIKHIGYVKNGIEDTESPEITKWAPAYENYFLKQKDNGTEFIVDMDAADEEYAYFVEIWPKALDKLKEISERTEE